MKAARAATVDSFLKHFPKEKAVVYEKAIFNVASLAADGEMPDVDMYASIAYERIFQLVTASNETDRLVILVDMQADPGTSGVSWDSCVYDDHKEKYQASIDRSQQRPKPVKGLHVCKNPRCGSDEFYVWSLQTRSSDEGMTNFRQCSKCGKRGRE